MKPGACRVLMNTGNDVLNMSLLDCVVIFQNVAQSSESNISLSREIL